jgi:amino acid permease
MTTQQATRKPGTKLLIFGAVLAALGAVFCIMASATTHRSLAPGTFQTVETQGSPGPLAWGILILGVALLVAGFYKRTPR